MERLLAERGARLDVLRGPADRTILALAEAADAGRVLWTRRYEAAAIALDARVKSALRQRGVEGGASTAGSCASPGSSRGGRRARRDLLGLLAAPSRARGARPSPARSRRPEASAPGPSEAPERVPIEALRLTPTAPDWSTELALGETPAKTAALAALARFVDEALAVLRHARDQLARRRDLSPFRPSSLRRAFRPPRRRRGRRAPRRGSAPCASRRRNILAELGWRDFARPSSTPIPTWPSVRCAASSTLSRGATTAPAFAPGRAARPAIRSSTPACASFGAPASCPTACAWSRPRSWQAPARRLAARRAMVLGHALRRRSRPAIRDWQWVAGCGADAAPYFRIFNPVLQAEKFDPDGAYVRRWVPELARLPAPDVHAPWRASGGGAGARRRRSGQDLSQPIVDHGPARARALAAFAQIKGEG